MHRRAGKTFAAVNHLIKAALINNNTKYAYIAPTYKQAKNIAWDAIKEFARVVPGVKFNESELRVDFPNGSRITLFGADNPDSLRGITLWGVIFDEYSQQPSNIWTEIISPTLSSTQGWAVWIGTPKGKNAFYRLYEEHLDDADWYTKLLRASESEILPPDELAIQRTNMSEDEYLQEYECSWEASIKGAYYAREIQRARSEGRITTVLHEPMLPVHTWWDLGVGDETTIIFMQNTGNQWRVIDCYSAHGEGFAHYAKILKEKDYVYGKHFAPHDIAVRMLGETAMTRLEIARNLGIRFETRIDGDKETTVVPMLTVDDGINALRMRFNTLWFDKDKCAPLIDALTHYRKKWNDAMGRFEEKPLHDWSSHLCFSADTKINTSTGYRKISKIVAGDYISTPLGESLVLSSNRTGHKKTYMFLGSRVTANHPYLTQRGFVPLDALRYDDIIYVCKDTQSQLMESIFTDTLKQKTALLGFTFQVTKRELEVEKLDYTNTFGKKKTIKKFLMDIAFTTKMVIRLITRLATWNVFQKQNIKAIMLSNLKEFQEAGHQSRLQENTQKYGTDQKTASSFINGLARRVGKIKNCLKEVVTCVEKYTTLHSQIGQSSALIIARLQCYEEEGVWSLSTSKGVFLANDVLVSNCDSMRYWAVTPLEYTREDIALAQEQQAVQWMEAKRNLSQNAR